MGVDAIGVEAAGAAPAAAVVAVVASLSSLPQAAARRVSDAMPTSAMVRARRGVLMGEGSFRRVFTVTVRGVTGR